MTANEDQARIDQIVTMAMTLAEQILAAHASGQLFDQRHFEGLAIAGRFLLENEIPWPSAVERAIEVLAGHVDDVKATPAVAER